MTNLYPLKFRPILKDRIWGGTKLKTELHKPTTSTTTGESWEISGVKGDISVVSNGSLAGKDLSTVISTYGDALLGKSVLERFGQEFPVLIKFIDAKEDLSIQVHPNDKLAEARHHTFGKNEMWYIMQADPKARLIMGFNTKLTQKEYLYHLGNKSLMNILNTEMVAPGDTFYIPTGTVHAIGGGILLAEIQQTSDITYRIYDFDRKDHNGNLRQLHTEEALEAIDYSVKENAKTPYSKVDNATNSMLRTPYFITNYINLTANFEPNLTARDSFTIYICIDGEGTFYGEAFSEPFKKGETFLLGNSLKHVSIKTHKATLLEVHL